MALLKFDQDHEVFRKTVKDFIEKEIRPNAEKWEEEQLTPRELWKKCGEMGFFGIHYPEALGGMGCDFTYTYIFFEEMGGCGSSGVSLGLCVQSDMATPALARHGSDFLREKYLIPALRGDMIASIAVSEPGAGSDVANIQTRARLDGDEWVINGSKTYITNGTQSDWLCLLARTSDEPGYKGLSLFVVPSDVPGYDRGKKLKKTCYMASDTAEIHLTDVRVPKENLIGEEGKGFYYQMEQFQVERLGGVIMALGAMKRSYDLTKRFISERQTFGRPLAGWQVIRHKMAQMLAEINMIEAFTHRCVAMANKGMDFTKDVSMLKLVAAQSILNVTGEAVQIHGGAGLMSEYEVSTYYRDAKLLAIGGGSNEMMKEIVCKMEGWA